MYNYEQKMNAYDKIGNWKMRIGNQSRSHLPDAYRDFKEILFINQNYLPMKHKPGFYGPSI